MRKYVTLVAVLGAFALLASACGDDDSAEPAATTTEAPETTTTTEAPETTTTTEAPETTTTTEAVEEEPEEHDEGPVRALGAPVADISVDGDAADWAGVAGLTMTLEAIEGEDFESKQAMFKVAHDGEFIYSLLEVDDDFDWNAEDPHLSASPSWLWAIDPGAGAHMGAEEPDRDTSLGLVDIWHWELECGIGEDQGGAVSDAGDGDPGNDAGCNFDDEWSSIPSERSDDNGAGAENSLLGVFEHSNPTAGEDGTWVFEVSRPLQTGDEGDTQFEVGGTYLAALAYWDADNSVEGWDDADHVQSSNQGFIEITLF